MTIRAVLFDLGDTLWYYATMPPIDAIRRETVRRILDLLRAWGIEPNEDHYFLGRDIRLAVERANEEAFARDCVSPHFPTLVREVTASKGLVLDDDQAVQLWHTWNLGGPFFGRTLFPDVLPTLDWLRAGGYRIGSVTNRSLGGGPFQDEMREYGLLDYFDVLSISCDVGYLKPHPRIFQHALDALAVAPEEALMVGDSLRADVAGAQALGMTAVWKRNHASPADSGLDHSDGAITPDFTIETVGELTVLPVFCPGGPRSGR